MKKRLIALLAAAAAVLSACETTSSSYEPPPPPPPPPQPPPSADAFREQDFAWSRVPGTNRIDGMLVHRVGQVRYTCNSSSVVLMPETPWTRRRVQTLYGATTVAAVPVDIVRSRTPPAPPQLGTYVRSGPCAADRFSFSGLPDGSWFLITVSKPAQGSGAQVAIMRRVETRGGRPVQVVVPGT